MTETHSAVQSETTSAKPLLSVVMPCLNEEEALPICIEKLKTVFEREKINAEIVVSDNGSTDRSVEIAQSMGVHLVHQPMRGYGNAYLKGFEEALGDYLIMVDADDTYDFNLIPKFLEELIDKKKEFVTGSRYLEGGHGHIKFLHRIIGNPLLTAILNFFFDTKYTDVYCGYRGFSRQTYELIKPVSPGMEFNLELAINAKLANISISEIPIVLAPRIGDSKLHTLRDGWRSLRFMILYSPNHIFLVPGITMLALGAIAHVVTLLGILNVGDAQVQSELAVLGTIFSVLGVEVVSLWLHAKTYSWSRRFDKENEFLLNFYGLFNLEMGLIMGVAMTLAGWVIIGITLAAYMHHEVAFGGNPAWVPFAATLIMVGAMTCFSSLFISAMSITRSIEPRSILPKK
ncbi:glycosyltransferase [Candidatus Obscuribacterales bacterium]|nr:glycosyltransferase [Candidatus Obscuribacterales bacterium]MBX3152835.1 glycosyltransferase [Candidatus Obscuribacterales bacterium]